MSVNPMSANDVRVLLKVEVAAGVEHLAADGSQGAYLIAPGETILVGRSKGLVHFAIEQDRAMSKQHFEMSCDGRVCQLTDMNSSNGTYLNGTRVTRANVAEGDRIRAGTSRLSVSFGPADSFDMPPERCDHDQTGVQAGDGGGETLDEVFSMGEARDASASPLVPRIVTLRIDDGQSTQRSTHVLSRLLTWLRPGQNVIVGSSADGTSWRIDHDAGVAPQHFEISFDNKACFLKSLVADRPTYVNGRVTSYQILRNGDTITAGNTTFLVEFA